MGSGYRLRTKNLDYGFRIGTQKESSGFRPIFLCRLQDLKNSIYCSLGFEQMFGLRCIAVLDKSSFSFSKSLHLTSKNSIAISEIKVRSFDVLRHKILWLYFDFWSSWIASFWRISSPIFMASLSFSRWTFDLKSFGRMQLNQTAAN